MLKEILDIFITKDGRKIPQIAREFHEMVELAYANAVDAGRQYFANVPPKEEDLQRLYHHDVKINKLERAIRKDLVLALSESTNGADIPYCLLMMTLIKDVERLGDYSKNLAEARLLLDDVLPAGPALEQLDAIRRGVEEAFSATLEIFESSNRERAHKYVRASRDFADRCDDVLKQVAVSSYSPAGVTVLTLGTRYYKRFAGHVANILSSVVMPLHKVDYYDEREGNNIDP